jgi:hypothetical protein
LLLQTAHRAALPDLRLSELFGIVVSSRYLSLCSSSSFFTVALHQPVRFFQRMQHKAIAVSGSIARRYRPASTETIRRSMTLALKACHFRK